MPYRLDELGRVNAAGWSSSSRARRTPIVSPRKDWSPRRARGGAQVPRVNSFSAHFADLSVVVLPDNDEPGRRRAADVAAKLIGIAHDVRVLELPGLDDKGDISDWLSAGHDGDELCDLVDAATVWTPGERRPTNPPPARTN